MVSAQSHFSNGIATNGRLLQLTKRAYGVSTEEAEGYAKGFLRVIGGDALTYVRVGNKTLTTIHHLATTLGCDAGKLHTLFSNNFYEYFTSVGAVELSEAEATQALKLIPTTHPRGVDCRRFLDRVATVFLLLLEGNYQKDLAGMLGISAQLKPKELFAMAGVASREKPAATATPAATTAATLATSSIKANIVEIRPAAQPSAPPLPTPAPAVPPTTGEGKYPRAVQALRVRYDELGRQIVELQVEQKGVGEAIEFLEGGSQK